jgi:class 3 adenylate cyclase
LVVPVAIRRDAAAATFVFADIAGYTALTDAHGDEQTADLVAQFFEAVSEELPSRGGNT